MSLRFLGIDPGNVQSAYIEINEDTLPLRFGILPNRDMRLFLDAYRFDRAHDATVAIEDIRSYGMAVGQTVLDTVYACGRFAQVLTPMKALRIPRKTVVTHICGSSRAKDKNVRQAILDRYPEEGGGKQPQVGTVNEPGPLYGVSKDVWQALAVALYIRDHVAFGLDPEHYDPEAA